MANFFLVQKNPALIESVKQAINANPDFKLLGETGNGKDALFQIANKPVQVALIQLALDDMNGLELVTQLVTKYPELVVVPMLEGNEGGDVWQHLLRLNLRNVVNGMPDPGALVGVLNEGAALAAQLGSAESKRGRSFMITVASARGGVGKTVFTTNLAISMARNKAEVSLIDYSMNAGDLITMMDQVPRNTMADVISSGNNLDLDFARNLMTDHPLGFKFLACPNQDFDYFSFTYENALASLDVMRGVSEFLIVDTGAFDMPPTTAAVDSSDLVFMITNRDLARLMSLQRYLKYLKDKNVLMEKIKVIVNNGEVGTEISESDIEGVIEHPVSVYLPSITTLATFSINSGKPLAQTKGDHPFCAVINKLAEYSIGHWSEG